MRTSTKHRAPLGPEEVTPCRAFRLHSPTGKPVVTRPAAVAPAGARRQVCEAVALLRIPRGVESAIGPSIARGRRWRTVAFRVWRFTVLSLGLLGLPGPRPVLAADQPASTVGGFPGVRVGLITDSSQLRWFFGENGYSVLDHADFAFQRNRAALYTELYSDYVYPFRLLGYVRTGLGVFIQSGEDTVVAANERMFNAGGNACVFFGLPLLSYASYVGQKEQGRLTVTLSPRVGVDIPAMGARVEHPTFSLDLSADIETRMRTFSDVLQVFGALRYGRRSGSPFFYDHLGHGGQGAFFLGTFKAGVIIASIVQISVTRTFLAPEEVRAAIQPTLLVQLSSRRSL